MRRPLLVVALLLAVLGLSGAGYAVTGGDRGGNAGESSALAATAVAAADDEAHRKAAKRTAQRERAAQLEAERVAAEKAAAEAAQKAAAEAEKKKQEAARQAAEAKRAAEAKKAEAKRAAEAKKAEQARQKAAARASREATRDPKSVARVMLADHGWNASQFSCLDRLWTKESNWKPTADNPTSSAYGIPQALPGSKMASAGADWRTNPVTQIRWGLEYIDDVYGSPCAAWGHSQAKNWY